MWLSYKEFLIFCLFSLIVTETVDLVPDGSEITVDNKNLPDYLDAQLKYRTMVCSLLLFMYACQCIEYMNAFTCYVVSDSQSVVRVFARVLRGIYRQSYIHNSIYQIHIIHIIRLFLSRYWQSSIFKKLNCYFMGYRTLTWYKRNKLFYY